MNERHEHDHRHKCECDSCCGDLFSCGDRIQVIFATASPIQRFNGTYISSECNRLIWRRDGSTNLECTPCEAISIIKLNS